MFFHEPPREVVNFFSPNLAHTGGDYSGYDVSPDPNRLLVFQRFIPESEPVTTTLNSGPDYMIGLHVARHWETKLTQR